MGLLADIHDNDTPDGSDLDTIAKQGVIPLTSSQIAGWASPPEGAQAFDTDKKIKYFYDGTNWFSYGMGIIDHDTIDGTATGLFNTTPTLVQGSGMVWGAFDGEWYAYDLQLVCQTNANGSTLNVELEINDGGGYTAFDVLSSVALPFLGVGYRSTIRAVWRSGVDGFVGIRAKASCLVGAGALTSNTDVTLTHLGSQAA